MRKILLLSLSVFTVTVFLAASLSVASAKGGDKVGIKLSPIPKDKTMEKGSATFNLNKDGTAIHYRVRLDKVADTTMGHIHEVGDDGTPSAILVWLYPAGGNAPSLREGELNGTLVKGEITADSLVGPLKGKTVKELYEELKAGKAGVAIHTKENPGGELWGFAKSKVHGEHKM